jgi:AhpD family alkylhydroperoxidase
MRLNFYAISPEFAKRLSELSAAIGQGSIEQGLRDLVVLRASQINHCAFCVDMHVKEAKIHGERELRLHHVAVWRESPLFSAREKAAFEWTETVTQVSRNGVTEDDFRRAKEHFSDKELSDLTFVIGVINFWNRLSVSFAAEPGSADKLFGLDKANLH